MIPLVIMKSLSFYTHCKVFITLTFLKKKLSDKICMASSVFLSTLWIYHLALTYLFIGMHRKTYGVPLYVIKPSLAAFSTFFFDFW